MNLLLIASIIIITLALIFYTIGVLGEAKRKLLEWKDVWWFAAGLFCDSTGTFLMNRISSSGEKLLAPWAGTLMAISGTVAIILMIVHIIFAVVVMKKYDEYRSRFHKWSLVIWLLWLFSYIVGPIGLIAG